MSDGSFDRVLRDALHRAAEAGPCPDPAELAAFYEGTLSRDEHAGIERHASNCARCGAELAVLARLAALDQSQSSPSRGFLAWRWRWLVPLATAVVVFAVWADMGHRPEEISEQAKTPAEQQPAAAPPSPLTRQEDRAKEYDQVVPPAEGTRKPSTGDEQERGGMATPGAANTAAVRRTAPPPPASPPPVLERKELGQAAAGAPAAPAPSEPPASAGEPEAYEFRVLEDTARAPQRAEETVAPPKARSGAEPLAKDSAASARADASRNKSADLRAAAAKGLLMVRFTDAILIRAGGGRIERSVDAGVTWRAEYSGATDDLLVGTCPSAEGCWFGGEGGRILQREISGQWSERQAPGGTAVVRIDAENTLRATVTTREGRRFVTADGGRSWTPAP
jgi:hypothetical protein